MPCKILLFYAYNNVILKVTINLNKEQTNIINIIIISIIIEYL